MVPHSVWMEKMMRVSQAGLTLGMTIVQKVRHSLEPSIFAASSKESGMPAMNCFIRYSPMGAPKAGTMMDR